jgi:hypothetical protein
MLASRSLTTHWCSQFFVASTSSSPTFGLSCPTRSPSRPFSRHGRALVLEESWHKTDAKNDTATMLWASGNNIMPNASSERAPSSGGRGGSGYSDAPQAILQVLPTLVVVATYTTLAAEVVVEVAVVILNLGCAILGPGSRRARSFNTTLHPLPGS